MKKSGILLTVCLAVCMLFGCGGGADPDKGIIYPSAPFGENANALLTDPYRFYGLDAANTSYWHAANTHDPVMIKEGDTYYAFPPMRNTARLRKKGCTCANPKTWCGGILWARRSTLRRCKRP